MNDKIKDIIDRARELNKSGKSKLDIAKFVHIELGKILIFDNSYTANYNKEANEDLTQTSRQRQKMILSKKTDISKKEQICKGMAEIYVAILNTIGITSKVYGVERKGDIDGAIKEDGTTIDVPEIYNCSFDDNFEIIYGKNEKNNKYSSRHYYGIFEIDGNEFVQDFLIDKALFRIKIGEPYLENNIPGLCLREDYKARAKQSLPLSRDYVEKIKSEYKEYTNEPNSEKTFQFLFEQLEKYNENFGYEESKDFFLSIAKEILPKDFKPQDLKVVNLIKENQSTCDIISIYRYNGINYLLRGGDKITTVRHSLGEINTSQIETLLSQGFEARKKSDMLILNELIMRHKSNISIKAIVSNAIPRGITTGNVGRIDGRNAQGNESEGRTKDE